MFSEKRLQAAVVTILVCLAGTIVTGLGIDLGLAILYMPGSALILMAVFGFVAIAWAEDR